MTNQHAGLSQPLANQRITQQRQRAAQARLSRAAHPPPLPAPRWDLVWWPTSPRTA
jgi:hypothetical protein